MGDSSSQPDTAIASVNATPYIIVGCIAAVAILAGVTVRQVRRRRRRMMGVLRLDDTLESKLAAVDNDAQVLPMPPDDVVRCGDECSIFVLTWTSWCFMHARIIIIDR